MKSPILPALALSAAMTLAACGSGPPVGPLESASGPTSAVVVADVGGLPPPTREDFQLSFNPYQIGPFDVLEIGVFGVEGLDRQEYRADASGRVSFPLVGTIDAGGMTPGQLEREIQQRLGEDFIREPRVTVNLKETTSRVVTIAGEVERPGSYPVLGNMTLVRAVAEAGGLEELADSREVIVFRTVNGQRMAAIYDLRGIQYGNYDDPELYASDLVVVGESAQRRFIRTAIGAVPAIISPVILTLFNN
ncbi:MAG: polysaccharide biosynthesis/export family protein [Erythrobacter sp.]|uniref:polysaccharide biosynthesis/export family protein n=1 Tax=Erythrobacter sp. TaxID=1042 RepID=UPI003C7116BD